MAMKKTNIPNTTSKKLIDEYLDTYSREYGRSDEVIEELFRHADNRDYYNILCRCGIIDLIYSTGIQRFNKGGIDVVTRHIIGLHEKIDSAKNAKDIDFVLFGELEKVDYKEVVSTHGRENIIPVFASKFMSFTNPEVYPIMDSVVKKVVGIRDGAGY